MSANARRAVAFVAGLVVASAAGRAGTGDVTLSRLSLDGGFGVDGSVTRIGRGASRIDQISNVVFDAQGRIVVAGQFVRGGSTTDDFYLSSRPAVARLLADGRPDRSFGAGGVRVLPFGGTLHGLAIDGAGRIVVTGTFRRLGALHGVGAPTFQVVRLRANGALDAQFSGDGVVGLGRKLGWEARAVRAAPDGSLRVLAARDSDASGEEFGVLRLTARGGVDKSFGTSGFAPVGRALTPAPEDPTGGGSVYDIAVDDQGRTLVATDGGLKRLAADGSRDLAFGTNGFAADATGAVIHAVRAVRIDGSGRPVVVSAGLSTGSDVVRFDASGALDTSFGQGGDVRLLPTAPADADAAAFVLDVDRATNACALGAQLTFVNALDAPPSRSGRLATAFDETATELGVRTDEDAATGAAGSYVGDVALAPGGRAFVVAGTLAPGSGRRANAPFLQLVSRDGATPLAKPNLRPSFVGTPAIVYDVAQDRYVLDFTVQIDETVGVAVPPMYVSIRRSADDVYDATDNGVYERHLLAVAANGSASFHYHFDPGGNPTPAKWAGEHLVVRVDPYDQVLETDETDGTAASAAFQ